MTSLLGVTYDSSDDEIVSSLAKAPPNTIDAAPDVTVEVWSHSQYLVEQRLTFCRTQRSSS
jgi:hypothetical protein